MQNSAKERLNNDNIRLICAGGWKKELPFGMGC